MKRNLLFSQTAALGKTLGKRLAMVLTMLLIVGIGQAWGEEVTINANQITGFGSGSNYTSSSITIDDITIASNSGFSTTQFRVAKSKNLVISCAGKMTKIVFTVSSTSYKLNATGITWNNTSGTYTNASGIESVTFTNSNANIARITKIVITYTPSSSGGDPDPCTEPTIEWNTKPTNGEVGGSMTASITTNYSDGLTYSSSNQTVAAVTDAGVINYLSAGTTTITATVTGDGTTICEGPVSIQQEITVTAPAGGGGSDDCDKWVEVQLADIEQTDDIVITMTNGTTTWALTNGNGTSKAPAATVLTVNPDKSISNNIISSAIKWNISNSSGTLTIYPEGSTSTWLYCTDTNNGVRVGTNANKTFTIDASSGYLKHTGTSRYVGVYPTNPDWRCYTSTTTSNISGQTLKFYKYVECTTEPTVCVIPKCGGDGGGTWLVVIEWFATF